MTRSTIMILSTIFISLCGVAIALFLPFHEIRADAIHWQLDDWSYMVLPAADVSMVIFPITYGSMVIYVISNYRTPYYLSRAFLAYGILLLVRIGTLALVPLKEADSIVLLEDPFLNYFIYSGNDSTSLINADLFFSGHTALLFLLYFLSNRKVIYLILGTTLAILLLIQRVHYTIDILGAIPFAYLAVRMSDYLVLRLKKQV
jgi:hypothetical protein